MATEDDPLATLRAKLAPKPVVTAPAIPPAPAPVEIVTPPVAEPALVDTVSPEVVSVPLAWPPPVDEFSHDLPSIGGASLEPLSPHDIAVLKVEKQAELEAKNGAETPAPVPEALSPVVALPASLPVTSEASPAAVGTIEVLLTGDTLDPPPPAGPLPPVEFSPSLVLEMAKVTDAPKPEVAPPPEPKSVAPPFTFFLPKPAVPAPVKPLPHASVGMSPKIGTPSPKSPPTPGAVPFPTPGAVVKPTVVPPPPKPGFFLKGPVALKEEKEQKERKLLEESFKLTIEEMTVPDRINACLALLRDARKGNDAFRARVFTSFGGARLMLWTVLALIVLVLYMSIMLSVRLKSFDTQITALESQVADVKKRLPPAWEMDCRLADLDKDWARGCVPRAVEKSKP